ncbi:hypothetical protein CASFOL_020006 [Castilleja foliolosa]|uniref:Reverse transcriptase zinc-binding domain-containing protein n=1 Tax=Castilleja foliolosa TaxID=1961234 RepID=A0ABD3D0X6_9LAMI
MNHKYKDKDGNLALTSRSSQLWKRIWPHIQQLRDNSLWVVGKGQMKFWEDNWIGHIINPLDKSGITVREGLESLDSWKHLLSEEQLHDISLIKIDDDAPDRLIFKGTCDGKFKTGHYISYLRARNAKIWWTNIIWKKHIPAKIGAFLWRVFLNAIPVDEKVYLRGILGPFKCCCCLDGGFETITHLLVNGVAAKKVWGFFGKMLNRRLPSNGFGDMVHHFKVWLSDVKIHSQLGMVMVGLYGFICWEIWKVRCKSKFEGDPIKPAGVIAKIKAQIKTFNCTLQPQTESTKWDLIILQKLCLRHIPVMRPRGKWVSWTKPPADKLKMNISVKEAKDSCVGGCLIRNHEGEILFWCRHITKGKEIATILEKIITEGLIWSKSVACKNPILESHLNLEEVSRGEGASPAMIYMARKLDLESMVLSLVGPKQNRTATELAKSLDTPFLSSSNQSKLGDSVRKWLNQDKLGTQILQD